MQYFKRVLLSIVVASGAISSANAYTQEDLENQVRNVDWVNPYNSTRAYDFGLDMYSQESESYIGIKAGQMLQDTVPDEHKSQNINTGIENLTADVTLDKYDEPLVYGVYGGHTWANGLGLEAQYFESNDGEIDDETYAGLYGNFPDGVYTDDAEVKGDIDVTGYGLSGTFKHRLNDSRFYIKAKVGATYVETEEDLEIQFDDATRSNAQEANEAARLQLQEIAQSQQGEDAPNDTVLEYQKQELLTVVNDTNIIMDGVKLDKSSNETEFTYGLGFGYNFKNNLSLELEYEKLGGDADMVTLGLHHRW